MTSSKASKDTSAALSDWAHTTDRVQGTANCHQPKAASHNTSGVLAVPGKAKGKVNKVEKIAPSKTEGTKSIRSPWPCTRCTTVQLMAPAKGTHKAKPEPMSKSPTGVSDWVMAVHN
jgi:hypothetical protein